ncbi:MAG TPA: Hsp20/alpha crystallin family protein [Acidimicrobiales bacterium]|nr:Hsp20/alpha crystallin family protein [Acidimicrobiales bacterium]
MPIAKRDRASIRLEPFERFFGDLPALVRWPGATWSAGDLVHVDEYREDNTLVVRAEMAGMDPEKDIEITVSDGMLHIGAERRQEEKDEGKDYYRQELRYGSFSRDLPLPEGVGEPDVTASYSGGILEIRVALPEARVDKAPKKIPVATH